MEHALRGAEAYFLLDHAVAEIGVGVRWLREQAGIETVVLLGNSGGGSLMAAYQSQAVDPNLAPEYGRKFIHDAAQEVPGADLYISMMAHLGRPEVLTNWMDPSVQKKVTRSASTNNSMRMPMSGKYPFPKALLTRTDENNVTEIIELRIG